MRSFPIRINWLPLSRSATVRVARRLEELGFEGMGVCDTPRGIDIYMAIEAALSATSSLSVGANVTNPSTRAWHVHAGAARSMLEHGDRAFLGFGTGDSAVRTFGGRPSTLANLASCVSELRHELAAAPPILIAASGPKGGRLAREIADGVVAGVGTSGRALRQILGEDLGDGQRWATLRVAIARDESDVERQRQRVLPRAISAARFAFGHTFEGKDVPEEFHLPLRRGFERYDFGAHGIAGRTPNADLFSDRPDIENYLLDRFAIVDTPERACTRLGRLADEGFTGAYLSIVFEDWQDEIDQLADALHPAGYLNVTVPNTNGETG